MTATTVRRPSARTYELAYVDAVQPLGGEPVRDLAPETLTLSVGGSDSHSRELRFAAIHAGRIVRAHLVLADDGLCAYGTLSVGRHDVVVEYRLAPQHHPMRLAAAA